MRQRWLASVATLVCGTAIANSPGGEIVYLPMDGSIRDAASGLPVVYAEGFSSAPGKFGSAVHSAGDGSAELPIDINPDAMPELTVSMWIRIDPLPESAEAIGEIHTNGILLTGGGLEISVANARKERPFIASTQWSGKHLGIRDYWMHIAVTRTIEDRNTPSGPAPHTVKTVYVNGLPVEYVNAGESGGSRSLYVGNAGRNASSAYRGAIDEVRIFQRILSAAEIEQLRQASTGTAQAVVGTDPGGGPAVATPEREPELTEEQYDAMSRRAAEREAADGVEPGTANTADVVSRNRPVDVPGPVAGGSTPSPDIPRNDNAVVNTNAPGANIAGDPNARIDEETQRELAFADWRIVGRERIPEEVRAAMLPGAEITIEIRITKNDPENKIPDVRLSFEPRRSGSNTVILPLRVMTSRVKPEATRVIPVTFTVPDDFDFEGGSGVLWNPLVRLIPAERGIHHLEDSIPDNHRRELSLRVLNPATGDECAEIAETSGGQVTTRECLAISDRDTVSPSYASGEYFRAYVDLDARVQTDISGVEVGTRIDIVTFRNSDILTYIAIGENSNKPCAVAATGNHNGTIGVDHCDGPNRDRKSVEAHPGWFVTGLAPCENLMSNRVKGVRIKTQYVEEDGSLSADVRFHEFEQQNCGYWQPLRECPAGMAAGGLVLSFDTGKKFARRDSLKGMGLVCGPVELRSE